MRLFVQFLIVASSISLINADNHAEDVEIGKTWDAWVGTWVRYDRDFILTKKITEGHETFHRRLQYGTEPVEFSDDMKISVESEVFWYTKFDKATGEARYKGAFKLHQGNYYEFNRGMLSTTTWEPVVWQWIRPTDPVYMFHQAARDGDLDSVKRLLADEGIGVDSTLNESYTALAYASAGGHLSVVKELLAQGADVNLQTRFSKSPLNHAIGGGSQEACELLIDAGARLDLRNDNGSSLLHEAAFWGQDDMVPFLISKGLKVNDKGQRYGATPLIYVINRANGAADIEAANKFISCSKALLKHGADADLANNAGKSARSIAAESKFDSVKALF